MPCMPTYCLLKVSNFNFIITQPNQGMLNGQMKNWYLKWYTKKHYLICFNIGVIWLYIVVAIMYSTTDSVLFPYNKNNELHAIFVYLLCYTDYTHLVGTLCSKTDKWTHSLGLLHRLKWLSNTHKYTWIYARRSKLLSLSWVMYRDQ